MARSDPTLYEWDRLTLQQQQAVLATIKAANLGAGHLTRRIIFRVALVIALAGAVAFVLWASLLH
ncbi:MAG TPA: hypothetical protein VF916_03315 [Ktedonobacterales bacterium]